MGLYQRNRKAMQNTLNHLREWATVTVNGVVLILHSTDKPGIEEAIVNNDIDPNRTILLEVAPQNKKPRPGTMYSVKLADILNALR